MIDIVPGSVPPRYVELAERLGAPLGVEEARTQWGPVIRAAEEGRTTLITRERWEWAALVPLAEVAEPLSAVPAWPLAQARGKLGELVRQVTGYEDPFTAVVLTRHRTPVAALLEARLLVDRPAPEHRLAVDALLQAGHRIILEFEAGEGACVDSDGEMISPEIPPHYFATARDREDNEVASGTGSSVAEALLCLSAPPPPYDGPFCDEAPF
ncbi:hypothetical protein OG339_48850 (plasmid) [Streptosporangium sp. NBC_01495]|uniref:hypothetical protein n=1 Tax=Streptosporangium sp. NBC_01495 TaxID=2903899 RepID=UPI002E321673|nr:hypothetical protein [Streptosporangium sp. NBC_01495]